MSKVLCFGELLLRFSPQLDGHWVTKTSMPVFIGGAELNVATALAKWQVPASYCTALPDNYLSKEIITDIQKKNIETNTILLCGNRIGTYYLPIGEDMKAAGVIYDRDFSSFAGLAPGQIDWEHILKDVSWFHFSAISPALNANVALICKQALQEATRKEIYISVDLNYRSKLWQYGNEPNEIMPDLVQYCDLVMGNIWSAEKMLDISIPTDFDRGKKACVEQAEKTSIEIMRRFSKCKQVANTFRFDADAGLLYYASLYKNNQLYLSNEYYTKAIVDKVGSGDCFMGGLIYGNYNNLSPQETIDFAASAAFNKLFIAGDATTSSIEEIKKGYINYA
jgi:2-dehydro-3-deoxygluconokinase